MVTYNLLTNSTSRPALRPGMRERYMLREVKAIVLHWTANTARGANAMANRNYFNLGSRPASAHYIVDDRGCIQCIPENEVAFHCGDRPEGRYRPKGRELLSGEKIGLTPNYFTIGVEYCVNADGNLDNTFARTVVMLASLLLRFNLSVDQLLRHNDVTGKNCPAHFLNAQMWDNLKVNVAGAMQNIAGTCRRAVVQSAALNVRSGPGASHSILYELKKEMPVLVFRTTGDWACIQEGPEGWVNQKFIKII
jgi:N-acetylmuramoyl-L-alanine amidase CwlA